MFRLVSKAFRQWIIYCIVLFNMIVFTYGKKVILFLFIQNCLDLALLLVSSFILMTCVQ